MGRRLKRDRDLQDPSIIPLINSLKVLVGIIPLVNTIVLCFAQTTNFSTALDQIYQFFGDCAPLDMVVEWLSLANELLSAVPYRQTTVDLRTFTAEKAELTRSG